jgi:hypothetical protein
VPKVEAACIRCRGEREGLENKTNRLWKTEKLLCETKRTLQEQTVGARLTRTSASGSNDGAGLEVGERTELGGTGRGNPAPNGDRPKSIT